MTTITLELPDELAARVRAHQANLSHILELGLRDLLLEKRQPPKPPDTPEQVRQKILEAWISTGLLVEFGSESGRKQHSKPFEPINARGKPASEIIIEQRGRL